MKLRSWKCALVVLGTASLLSCGTARQSSKSSTGQLSRSGGLDDMLAHPHVPNEKVSERDLNHDRRADVWTFTVPAKNEDGKDYERLIRKELDVNFDGKVDIVRTYDDKERIDREAMDLDFDGKVDQVNFYEKGVLVRKEKDLNFDAKPDEWQYFEKSNLVRLERDTNGDGRVDYWEYWENGQVDRIGEDLDFDGNVDRWSKNPNNNPS